MINVEHLTKHFPFPGAGTLVAVRDVSFTVSPGLGQAVNRASARFPPPPVLLVDEPTLRLDVLLSQLVTEYIHHLRDEGKAVILTTHYLDQAERLCTRFGLFHKGRLVIEGTLSELRSSSGCTNLTELFLKLSQVGPTLRSDE